MAKIKNMGSATMRFGEGIIVTGSAGTDDYALVITGSSNITENLIIDGKIGIGTDNPAHKLEVGGSISVGEYIYHRSDTDTFIRFQEDDINISAGGRSFIKIEEDAQDQISVGLNSSYGSDVFLSVSGSINTGQDLSVFGGDVLVSGSLNVSGYTLPTSDGSANQVIKTDGSGNLSFTNQAGGSGSPGGSDTHIQINDGGSFGGVTNLTYDGDTLFVSGSMQIVGETKINDPTYATGEQANRSFTLKRHYDISLSPNTWTDVISWRPYITGGTTEPTHFYTAVAFKMEIFGHQNGVNNGYRSRKGMVSYEGSSAANAYATDDTLGSGPISTQVSRSGWVTTLQVNANSGGAQAFRGGVYVEIHFPRGAGTNGEQIYWSVT